MEPTLFAGGKFWASRSAYLLKSPTRGDIVLIRSHSTDRIEIKRIIGLPGERLTYRTGSILINGRPLQEPYVRGRNPVPGDEDSFVTELGPSHYFVLGDNRLFSRDSRMYGPIARRQILAKVMLP